MRNEGIAGGEIVMNGTKRTVNEMRLNGAVIWPTSYRAVLVPTWGACGGDYTTATVPASGGYASVSWELRIYRGSQSTPVYTSAVTPTYVNITDEDGFTYSNGRLTAKNRGRNGIDSSSGTDYPQSAPRRTCYIYYASKTVTYDGKQLSAVFYSENTFGMTQLANSFQWGSGGYRNIQVTLGAYTDQNSPAPAGESTTTVSAQCQFHQNAVFASGESYEYQEQITAQNRFTFSSTSDWITFPSSGTVKIASRGYTEGAIRPGTVTATVSGTSDSGNAQLWQAANAKTMKSDETITISKIALYSVSGPISVLGTTITFSGKIVTGQKKAPVYSWSSGAPDTGGEVTDLANTDINPDSIAWKKGSGSYTWVTGRTYTVAHNKHTLNAVSWSFKGAYRGCTNCDAISVTQSADSKTTVTGDSNYGVKFEVSGTNGIGPAGGYANIACEAWHYHGTTVSWDSDGEVIAAESSNEKVTDTFTITKIAGSDAYYSINAAQTKVTHTRNMEDNETTDTVTYRLKNSSDQSVYKDLTFSATNAKDGSPTYTTWADVGGKINEQTTVTPSDYKVSTFSAARYTNSSSPAPWGGGTSQLSWAADHLATTTTTWKQKQERTKSQLYTSGYTKTTTEEQTVDCSSSSSERVGDTPAFSSNKSWATVSNAGLVTIGENSGSTRNATITATNGTASKTITIYQAKKVAISVNKSSLTFDAAAGSATFVVAYQNVTFAVSHSAVTGSTDPVSNMSPTSGGSATGSSTRTVTVQVSKNSGTSQRLGVITVTPESGSGLSAISIDVVQAAAEVTGVVTGYANAGWNGSTQIDYQWSLHNSGSASKTIQNITLYLNSTPEGEGDPDESDKSTLVASKNLGNVTVGGYDDTSWESGSFTGLTRNLNRTYWVKLIATGLESDWNQIEESV